MVALKAAAFNGSREWSRERNFLSQPGKLFSRDLSSRLSPIRLFTKTLNNGVTNDFMSSYSFCSCSALSLLFSVHLLFTLSMVHLVNMTLEPSEEGTAADIIKEINSKNAKTLAVILVCGFFIYHGILHVRYGIDSCKWLLTDGRYKGNMEWQPFGCMMHHYTLKDTRQCFHYLAFLGRHNHFVFAGDSSIRLLYLAFLHHLRGSESPWRIDEKNLKLPHLPEKDTHFEDNILGLRVDYIPLQHVNKDVSGQLKKWIVEDEADVVVFGSGVDTVRSEYEYANAVNESLYNVSRLAQGISLYKNRQARIMWVPLPPSDKKRYEELGGGLTNSNIDRYNTLTAKILDEIGVQIWWSSRLLAKGRVDKSSDGFHPDQHVLAHDTQILLNMYCNDYMNYNDGTCCWSGEPYTILQVISASAFFVCIVLTVTMILYRLLRRSRGTLYIPVANQTEDSISNNPSTPNGPCPLDWSSLLFALSRLGLIMAFFYVCDRTSFFMKENKYYSTLSFWLPIVYVVALGLFFTEDSRYTKVLHRDQTNEWKGWMQLIILIYHMTDASAILPIYMHIRVLISAYLFLCGYGHFCYFWQRGDAGIVRFLQVLFRLNFLTVTLCLCMNRPYQFYQFTPLISWWVFSLFVLLAIPPHVTAVTTDTNTLQYFYLVLKFVIFLSVITVLYMSEVFFEKVFVTRPWKALFVTTDDDIHEWWFRWKLDRYSVSYGMLYAVILLLAQRYSLLDDRNHSNLLSPRLALTSVVLALAGLAGYVCFSFLCGSQPDCNEIHPYVVFIPIVSYIVLRNISGVLRTRYSAFFAWFGRMSLELSLCQYHVWLAADANGVLVLVPGYPVVNSIITSFIFICISHEVHCITAIVSPYAVPTDWRHAVRNAIFFAVPIIVIGIYAGMF